MAVKDHYKTLEIPALVSEKEIKQAYRNLARKYHPDKNNNDPTATMYFQEIQAAYEVLSDSQKRKIYDQELRRAGQYSGFNKDEPNSVTQIVKQTRDLLQYITTMGSRSINYDALTDFILGILNKENMALLLRADNKANNEEITSNILQVSKGILATRLFVQIADQLQMLYPDKNNGLNIRIEEELIQRQVREKQNKRVPYAALGIIVVIIAVMCAILFSSGK